MGNQKTLQFLKVILWNGVICLVLVEIIAAIAIEVFGYTGKPYFRRGQLKSNTTTMIVDIDPKFGVWHLPNTTFLHQSDCFSTVNVYNSDGARDVERAKKTGEDRILCLGDSYVEGFGVDQEDRLSNLLEKELAIEVMNFGTSGDFGTTQACLLYEKFGAIYDHSVTMLGVLPFNDFDDNSVSFGKKFHQERYRPYFVERDGQFDTEYFIEELEESAWHPSNMDNPYKVHGLRDAVRYYSYTYHILAGFKSTYRDHQREKHRKITYSASRFRKFSEEELEILIYGIGRMKELCTRFGSRLLIFTIPTMVDIRRNSKMSEPSKLAQEIERYCKSNDIYYVDLLAEQIVVSEPESLFFSCDEHWSPKGHLLAAQQLKPILGSILKN